MGRFGRNPGIAEAYEKEARNGRQKLCFQKITEPVAPLGLQIQAVYYPGADAPGYKLSPLCGFQTMRKNRFAAVPILSIVSATLLTLTSPCVPDEFHFSGIAGICSVRHLDFSTIHNSPHRDIGLISSAAAHVIPPELLAAARTLTVMEFVEFGTQRRSLDPYPRSDGRSVRDPREFLELAWDDNFVIGIAARTVEVYRLSGAWAEELIDSIALSPSGFADMRGEGETHLFGFITPSGGTAWFLREDSGGVLISSSAEALRRAVAVRTPYHLIITDPHLISGLTPDKLARVIRFSIQIPKLWFEVVDQTGRSAPARLDNVRQIIKMRESTRRMICSIDYLDVNGVYTRESIDLYDTEKAAVAALAQPQLIGEILPDSALIERIRTDRAIITIRARR